MIKYLKKYSISVFLFCLIFSLQSENVYSFQPDTKELRKSFTEAIGQDFEIVKDILDTRPVARGGETYWLVHVKPKRAGHYTIKYTFKYTHKFSHPEEGEHELYIRVGKNKCHRYNQSNWGLSNVCLGDTVIVPIRIDRAAGHQFSLKSNYQDGENIGKEMYLSSPRIFSNNEQVNNPLEKHLKYLGTERSVMPHRGVGAETITYTAFFEAQSVGRFNLGLSNSFGKENADNKIKMNPLEAFPIIIVNPGTPITALLNKENTINYSDNKRFSAHSGHSFLTKILILQPGDVFEIQYAIWTRREDFGQKKMLAEKEVSNENPKLLIHKLPFMVNKDWSYNEWLIDYLPSEN